MNSIIVTILVAALGGTLGAGITAGAGLAQSRRATREKAGLALWAYQRALAGFAISRYQSLGYDETRAHFLGNDFKEVTKAYRDAYPWAGYVRPKARKTLFRSVSIVIGEVPYDDPDDIIASARSADELADRLEKELDRAFPLRFGDGIRSWFRRD